MSFHNILLPTCLEPFLLGKLVFTTSKIITASGREIRSLDHMRGRAHYLLKDCCLSEADFAVFNNFFKGRRGSRFAFVLKDFADHEAEKQAIGRGDGEQKTFAFYKTYADAQHPYIRKISKVKKDNVKVYINDEELIEAWQIDENNGLLTLERAPNQGVVLTASFEFYIVVRFDADSFDYEQKSDGTIEILNVSLVEVLE